MKAVIFKVSLLIGIVLSASNAFAITIDGGVTDWFNNSNEAFSKWTPTDEVTNWVNHDGVFQTIAATANWNNEAFDIKMGALAVKEDGLYLMFVLTNFNIHEDLAISINGTETHQFGVEMSGLNSKPGKVQNRGVFAVDEWATTHASYKGLPDWSIVKGDYRGDSQFIVSSIGNRGSGTNYLMEGFVAWDLLGGVPADSVCVRWSEISCLRDSLGVCASTTAVPEPASMLLLSGGLFGWIKRKKFATRLKGN